MKKLIGALLCVAGFSLSGCVSTAEEGVGSIYGVVTEEGTTEVMEAISVGLYRDWDLLLRTVTYSDGHYEFTDLKAGGYLVKIAAEGYEEKEYTVAVESNRQARQDIQLKKVNTHMSVRTLNVTNQYGSKVTLNGYVSYDQGGYTSYRPSDVGFFYSTSSDPLAGTKVVGKPDSTYNSFTAEISNLSYGSYYLQAYARNNVGVSYGDIRAFEMTNFPVVETAPATNVLAESATLNGKIVSEGDPAYTERGFVYSRSYSTPTVGDPENSTTKIVVPGTNSEFSANISSLTENATYYIRAYATHVKGTVYGDIITIVPRALMPVVVTLDVSNILSESATLNGRIDESGEPPYTERGFVYSTSYRVPTLNDPISATYKKEVPGQDKVFSANLDNLVTNTRYYVRAYALGPKGAAYGDTLSFVPQAILPVVVTLDVNNILVESATLNGRIDDSGEPAYTERGFVYSQSYEHPTVNDPASATCKVIVPGTDREYSANVDSLITGKLYYVCAYAKSPKGVSYGNVNSFKPQNPKIYVIEEQKLMVQTEDLASGATWEQAKELCEKSTVGGYKDWRLPSLTECNTLYKLKNEIGGFAQSSYWTSDTYSSNSSYAYYYYYWMDDGSQGSANQSNRIHVRAVRSLE